MSIELNQIVINKRSGIIHTKKCEAVTQMKKSNKHIELIKNINQIENKKPCGHCLRKRDLKKIYAKEYKRRKKQEEERRQRDHQRIDHKYDSKQETLHEIYLENIEGLDD